jgi:hypothetical protein
MKLRGLAVLAALAGAGALAGWDAIGGFGSGSTEAMDGGQSIVAKDAVGMAAAVTAEQGAPVAMPVAAAAVVDASLLIPYPLVAASAAPVQRAALSAPESVANQAAGSVRSAPAVAAALVTAAAPATKKTLVEPRLEKDGTLSLVQIARIKASLNLSPDQEQYWIPVEAELRAIARQLAAQKASGRKPTIALSANEAQRLYWVAGPLIMSLREDQKREVRRLARGMGLEQVASLL